MGSKTPDLKESYKIMKKSIIVIAGALAFALVATATDIPKFETFLGYTYVRANQFNQNTGLGKEIGGFDMNGGSAQFIYNFNKSFSGVADVGAVAKQNVGIINADDTTTFYLFGPRWSYRNHSRFTPYAQILFGGATRAVSRKLDVVTGSNIPVFPVVTPHDLFPGADTEITAQVSASQTAFAMAVGGGLDWKLSKRFSFRPVAVDYVLTRFPSLLTGDNHNQNSIRASAGFLFTFGEK
jgi:opacity protein-like surface antigen